MTALGDDMAGLRGKEVRWLEMETGSRVGEEAGRVGPCCHVDTVWHGRILVSKINMKSLDDFKRILDCICVVKRLI